MTPEQSELLIRIDQKLEDFSVINAAEHASIKKTQDVIDGRLNETKKDVFEALNHRPKWDIIMWILGGVFAGLITIGTMTYHINNNIEKHIVAGEAVWMKDNPGEDPVDLHGD